MEFSPLRAKGGVQELMRFHPLRGVGGLSHIPRHAGFGRRTVWRGRVCSRHPLRRPGVGIGSGRRTRIELMSRGVCGVVLLWGLLLVSCAGRTAQSSRLPPGRQPQPVDAVRAVANATPVPRQRRSSRLRPPSAWPDRDSVPSMKAHPGLRGAWRIGASRARACASGNRVRYTGDRRRSDLPTAGA
jgi:hypothetical protein